MARGRHRTLVLSALTVMVVLLAVGGFALALLTSSDTREAPGSFAETPTAAA